MKRGIWYDAGPKMHYHLFGEKGQTKRTSLCGLQTVSQGEIDAVAWLDAECPWMLKAHCGTCERLLILRRARAVRERGGP